ncbi:hypothetical protein [Nocardioides flavus (ex Wang et al. 2016)]|uniref:hypothetical protein n=1 Tax=Nocardioides flavus (ex Wang et al. 2016) TaxID=2058780 RepID=UPI00174B1E1C|nr:hypothetical protein [Nocardioides flavus (ex Wang et al. 2016)]
MTGDVSQDDDAEALVASRTRAYAEPAPVPRVPSPHLALEDDGRRSTRLGTLAFWCGYALAMGHLAWASDTDHPVSGLATSLFLVGLVGLPVVMWRVRRRAQVVDVRPELARAWLDVLDGLRLGAVEPANPASRVALARVGEVRRLVARDLRRIDQRIAPAPQVVAAVQDAGARTWAASEAWRRAQNRLPQGRGRSPLDRLPARLGPTAVEASAHSDAAADAATEALGAGAWDLDFATYARRRAAMYGRARGDDVRVLDPAEPLEVGRPRVHRTRRRVALAAVVLVASALTAWALASSGALGWSAVSAVPAYVVWLRSRRLSWGDLWSRRVTVAPGPAMAWGDYLDAVAHADSGHAAVTTVESIRGSEERVRAIMMELTSPSATEQDRPALVAELHRLCSEAWTLVGQERAEARLLDELDDAPHDDAPHDAWEQG